MSEHPSEEARQESASISRRGFLKGVGGGLLGTVAAGEELLGREVDAALAAPERLRGVQRIELEVNGRKRRAEVEVRTTLLRLLRDHLGLSGAKDGCDRAQCGACTVLVEGRAVLACAMLAVEARGLRVTTVEGLAPKGELSPLQQAFVEKDALMCGFCTPGLIMAATALLQENPHPDPEEIRAGLAGNLCRCGAYPKVFEAVQAAARRPGAAPRRAGG